MRLRAIPGDRDLVTMPRPGTFFFTRFAGVLRMAQCLGLALVLAQGTTTTTTSSSGSGTDTGEDQPPPVVETKVPGTMEDAACDSGKRNIVKIFKGGSLVRTERRSCVGS